MSYIGRQLNVPASTVQRTASGTLSSGDTVIVNSDGTVSVVEGVAQGVGSAVVFEEANTNDISATFDSANNKVVIAYRDSGNSNYGTAIVGTVSGTSISFGTPVVFRSVTAVSVSATFDSNSNKVVVSYTVFTNNGESIVGTVSGTSISFGSQTLFDSQDVREPKSTFDSSNNRVVIVYSDFNNSRYGTAIIGTVSGTSISFGSKVVFESAETNNPAATFDSNSNKVVVAYRDENNGRDGTAIVGTVSGTSISFGSATVFDTGYVRDPSLTFDSSNNKVVIAYKDEDNSFFGAAVVGTVSSTSISFGTPVVFEEANTDNISTTFDSANNKVVIAYDDNGNSSKGTVIVGTVSGTSISFETPVIFEEATTATISTTFDSNEDKIVIAYKDDDTNYGNSVVFQNGSTNLTSENFIGFAENDCADNGLATIQLGGSVNDKQTSLTAGQTYFVQTDGTIGTTADSPPVTAGTAVSSTKILVKG